jgi:hypothetical protein
MILPIFIVRVFLVMLQVNSSGVLILLLRNNAINGVCVCVCVCVCVVLSNRMINELKNLEEKGHKIIWNVISEFVSRN